MQCGRNIDLRLAEFIGEKWVARKRLFAQETRLPLKKTRQECSICNVILTGMIKYLALSLVLRFLLTAAAIATLQEMPNEIMGRFENS